MGVGSDCGCGTGGEGWGSDMATTRSMSASGSMKGFGGGFSPIDAAWGAAWMLSDSLEQLSRKPKVPSLDAQGNDGRDSRSFETHSSGSVVAGRTTGDG